MIVLPKKITRNPKRSGGFSARSEVHNGLMVIHGTQQVAADLRRAVKKNRFSRDHFE